MIQNILYGRFAVTLKCQSTKMCFDSYAFERVLKCGRRDNTIKGVDFFLVCFGCGKNELLSAQSGTNRTQFVFLNRFSIVNVNVVNTTCAPQFFVWPMLMPVWQTMTDLELHILSIYFRLFFFSFRLLPILSLYNLCFINEKMVGTSGREPSEGLGRHNKTQALANCCCLSYCCYTSSYKLLHLFVICFCRTWSFVSMPISFSLSSS